MCWGGYVGLEAAMEGSRCASGSDLLGTRAGHGGRGGIEIGTYL